jgi:hypothetical protein
MLNQNTASTQMSDASGHAVFATAPAPPWDIHIFSPNAGGAKYSPEIFSYLQDTATTVYVDAFSPTGTSYYGEAPLTENVPYGGLTNYLWSTVDYLPSGLLSFNVSYFGSTPFAQYAFPGDSVSLAAIQLDTSFNPTGKAYFAPQAVMGATGLTVTGSVSTTGVTQTTVTVNPVDLGSHWPFGPVYYFLFSGPSSSNLYFSYFDFLKEAFSGVANTSAPATGAAVYPAGSTAYRLTSYGSDTTCATVDCHNWGVNQYPSDLSTPINDTIPGPVTWFTAPNSGSSVFSVSNTVGVNGNIWTLSFTSNLTPTNLWRVMSLGAASGTTLSGTLPAIFPAGAGSPTDIGMGTGLSFTAAASANDFNAAVDPGHIPRDWFIGSVSNFTFRSGHTKSFNW